MTKLLEKEKSLFLSFSKPIEKRQAEKWAYDNWLAIEEYNIRVEQEGLFSDGIRGI